MNKVAKISMVALGAVMVSQAVKAQYTDDQLLLGFTSSTSDYVVDLGFTAQQLAGNFGTSPATPSQSGTQIGGAISLGTYSSTFSSGADSVGIIAGESFQTYAGSSHNSIFTTTVRSGADPTQWSAAGTEGKPTGSIGNNTIGNLHNIPGGVVEGSTSASLSLNNSWTQLIAADSGSGPTFANQNWAGAGNPMASLSSQPVTLDLWSASQVSGLGSPSWKYLGDIEVDMTGATPSVIWDPVAVPEPATYGLLGAGGLLAFVLRRRAGRKNA